MSVRRRSLLTVVATAFLAALGSGRAAGADDGVAPAAPTTTGDPGMPAPTEAQLLAPPEQPPVTPLAPPSPAAPTSADLALKRVLRSGCREGIADVRALAGAPNARWAATIIRLCADIVAERNQETPRRALTGGNEGRGRLVVWSSLYGIWLGIAIDIMFDIDGDRAVIVPPLLGLGAGLGLSLAATSDYQLSVGEAWTIITGLDYGTINGALWAGGLDFTNKGIVGTAVATSIAATSVGVLVANTYSPTAGDIEVVRSGILWGGIGGLLLTFVVSPDAESQSALKAVAAAMDAGFIAGVGIANTFDLSRNRVLIIDADALTGGVIGLRTAWLALGIDNSGRGLAGASLAGMLGGIAIAAYASRDLDDEDQTVAAGPSLPALLARGADGRWRFGTPGTVPVFDGAGSRLIGATFSAVGVLF